MEFKVGKPPKFKTVEELQKKIEEYFESCFIPKLKACVKLEKRGLPIKDLKPDDYYYEPIKDKDGKQIMEQIRPFTVTGLAIALGTTRETLLDYEKDNENFARYSDTIKKAKAIIQNYAEEYLYTGKNVVGGIFNLKANWGWKEPIDIKHSGEIGIKQILEDISEQGSGLSKIKDTAKR